MGLNFRTIGHGDGTTKETMSIRQIDRDEVRRLAAERAHVVDVLPRAAYRALHIAGALSIPLGELDREAAARLSRGGRAVIVYCNDYT
jgi:rhodanese-related sulfurtransferase